MYFSLTETWLITVKTEHEFRVHAVEGLFQDSLKLYLDDELVAHAKVHIFSLKGYQLVEVDGRTLEFRWVWGLPSGHPISIVIMHKGRILAQYGNDKAAKDIELDEDE